MRKQCFSVCPRYGTTYVVHIWKGPDLRVKYRQTDRQTEGQRQPKGKPINFWRVRDSSRSLSRLIRRGLILFLIWKAKNLPSLYQTDKKQRRRSISSSLSLSLSILQRKHLLLPHYLNPLPLFCLQWRAYSPGAFFYLFLKKIWLGKWSPVPRREEKKPS